MRGRFADATRLPGNRGKPAPHPALRAAFSLRAKSRLRRFNGLFSVKEFLFFLSNRLLSVTGQEFEVRDTVNTAFENEYQSVRIFSFSTGRQ